MGKVEIETIIKKIQGRKLKQTEKNYLYRSIRPKLIAARMLAETDILKKINTGRRDSSMIEYNLSLYGFPLLVPLDKTGKKIPVEELITTILLYYPKPRYIEAIPIILIKNTINKYRLLDLASANGIKNKIGYLLETAFLIKPLPYLQETLEYLKMNKEQKVQMLAEGDADFLAETSRQRIRKWNLLGRFFDEDFHKLAGAYL